METVILGDGAFGRAIAAALLDRGEPTPRLVGRPGPRGHRARDLGDADVGFDASVGPAVRDNVDALLAAGCRRIVIATTAWDADRRAVEGALRDHRAAAIAASNFSLGVALFGRLVDRAVDLLGPLESFDPYVVEWHRRGKADRPSGTARDLAGRIVARHRHKLRVAGPTGRPAPDELEVTSVRAGSSPGMHLVGFDAPGETIELRHTARDRSSFAAGALAAADWLVAAARSPGIHPFERVVDDLLEPTRAEVAMPVAV